MSLTYMRAQLGAALQFWFVLLGAVVLLYLIGDVTENFDAWTGVRGSALIRLAEVSLGLGELLLRVMGLLTAFALVFAWSRSATQGELTAVEAAGYSPWVHWIAVAPVVFLSLGSTAWFYAQGERQFSVGRAVLASLRQGGTSLDKDQRLLAAEDGVWLILNAQRQVQARVVLDVSERRPVYLDFWRGARQERLTIDGASVSLLDVKAPAVTASKRPQAQETAVIRTGIARGAQQAIFALWMLLVGWGVLVRHGRGGGLASQVISGVLSVTVLWILSQVVDYVLEQDALRGMVTLTAGLGVLTILALFRRIRGL